MRGIFLKVKWGGVEINNLLGKTLFCGMFGKNPTRNITVRDLLLNIPCS